ncbi:hypothetical protein BD414DRAFT_534441 [Trametes punicea]|nr:hypothetical protein BD414DRAFT_534441 [Trametes punicea]
MSAAQPSPQASQPSAQKARVRSLPPKPDFAHLRQLTLDSGRIIDLPISILQDPPPKPIEFVHLQHYFSGRRGAPLHISECESADDAIDLLADEVEAMRLLLYGYVLNFRRYVDRFEEAQAHLLDEINGVDESYQGLVKLVEPAYRTALEVEAKFLQLEKRIAQLPVGGGEKPPKIRRGRRGGLANPPLSKEENQTMLERQGQRAEERAAINGLIDTENKLHDAARLKEAMQPPPPAPKPEAKSKAKAPRPKQPLTEQLTVKINKVVEDVEDARKLLHAARIVTTNNLVVLRYREDEGLRYAKQFWSWHDVAESLTVTAGKVSQLNERRLNAYDKWASNCEKRAAASKSEGTTPDAPEEPSASEEQRDAAPATDSPPSPCPISIPISSAPEHPPSLDGDLYAITLDLTCKKPYDELTREEAIEVLKSLPMRVHFVPYIGAERPENERCNGADADAGQTDASEKSQDVTDDSESTVCPSPSVKAATASSPVETPASSFSERCAVKPRSRKRRRQDDDADEKVKDTDSPPEVNGSPVKKKRGSA